MKLLPERRNASLRLWVIAGHVHEHADAPHNPMSILSKARNHIRMTLGKHVGSTRENKKPFARAVRAGRR
jgi:hypothetical protein